MNDKLVPVLNTLENSNLNGWAAPRNLWVESFIIKENPLKIKYVYHFSFIRDSIYSDYIYIVNDSTIVSYKWDERRKEFVGNFPNSKITEDQILSYYLTGNELFFINVCYNELKRILNGKDKNKRKALLVYLNESMNYYFVLPVEIKLSFDGAVSNVCLNITDI